MKGIVVEINNKDAVILSEEGLFTKIKNENYQIGQAIRIKEQRRTASKWIAGAASMAAALAFCTIGAFAYYTPTDYVSMDVNPSVEYSVNRFDRILDVKALNDDGKAILSGLDLKNKTIQDGVKETLDQLIADGYLADDPGSGVVIATSNDDMEEAEQLAAKLKLEITTYLDTQDGVAAEVDAEAVGLERVEEARDLGVTPGKLNLVEKLQDSTGGAISKEEWLAMPVKEINKAIKENRRLEREKGMDKNRDQNIDQDTDDGQDVTGVSDREDAVSKSGIKEKKNDQLKPNQKGNQKQKQQEDRQTATQEAVNVNEDQDADEIKNKTDKTDSEERLKDENSNNNSNGSNNGSRNDDKDKPDSGKTPKGSDD